MGTLLLEKKPLATVDCLAPIDFVQVDLAAQEIFAPVEGGCTTGFKARQIRTAPGPGIITYCSAFDGPFEKGHVAVVAPIDLVFDDTQSANCVSGVAAPVKSLPDEASVYGSHMNSDPGPGIYAFKGKAGNEEPRSDPSFETDNAYTTLILPCPVMIIPINLRTPPYYY
ncbi:unnamed protein product [Cuscuta epithymum]|uniref:Uncharacterized protein n=1 Tax=Cuscuta epithymum TaxID=186058 RepID=A0AAV0DW09_9ASTE|nr:unnamed protein product [Cuscuta epithymum]